MDSDDFEDMLRTLQVELRTEQQEEQETSNDTSMVRSSGSDDRSDRSANDYRPLEVKSPPVGSETDLFYFAYEDANTYTDNEGELFTWAPERNYRRDLISFCEEYYYAEHRLPGPKELQLRFAGYPECPRYLKDWPREIEDIRGPLEARGLFVGNEPVGQYPVGFVSAVHLILNYNDKRTIPAKLKSLGISSASWNAWLKKKECREYYRVHCEDIFNEEFVVESQRSLMSSVAAGDLQALRYYNEITGIYRPQESATQHVIATLMTGLFEILAKHLSQDIIAEIGAEIRNAPSIKRVMGAIEAETHEYPEVRDGAS